MRKVNPVIDVEKKMLTRSYPGEVKENKAILGYSAVAVAMASMR